MKKSLCIALFGVFIITACSKDKEDTRELSEEAVSGSYVLINVTALSGTVEKEVTEFFMVECEEDDLITFEKDNTFKVTDDGIQCTPPTEEEGEWSLPGNSTIDLDGEIMKVTRWNGAELHFSRQEIIDGNNAVVTFKLKKMK